MKPKGQVYMFTGDGKGKTSAALGVALRAVGNGMKIAIVQWYKQPSWDISEHHLPQIIKKLKIYPMGKGFHIKTKKAPLKSGGVAVDTATEADHKKAAQAAFKKAFSLLKKVDVLVLDEINNALDDKLLTVKEVSQLITSRGKTHLILTGRNAKKSIIAMADLVTEMKKVKHPFDQGQPAIKGLDF